MMDEEMMSNQAQRQPPGPPQRAPMPQEGADQEQVAERGQGREASAQEQKAFETLARQALQTLTSESSAKAIEAMAKQMGPEQAIAQAVSNALDAIAANAQSAGVELTPEVRNAAAQPVVLVLAKIMEAAGMAEDARALASKAMQIIQGG